MSSIGERADAAAGWFRASACRVAELEELLDEAVEPGDYPHASRIEQNVVCYDGDHLRSVLADPSNRRAVLGELARVFSVGPGIASFAGAVPTGAVDAATGIFEAIIAEQRAAGSAAGDHYAKPGANDRIWNALEKLALWAPEVFVDYYGNDVIALASEAWLGPAYQLTSQINVVNPGGEAQSPHRDYHVGFMTDEQAERYPAHVHGLSGLLTLQGAVAHVDMPVESGPTTYLPHSHRWGPGFLGWRRDDVQTVFEARHVQLPLGKGDAVFFNPAVFHAAGTNGTSDVRRMGNLLQVSSPFGRAMESIDREAMVSAIYPVLLDRADSADPDDLDRAIAASAEGYPFPTNLDRDQPLDGLAPDSQADIVRRALAERRPVPWLAEALDDWTTRRRTR